MVFATSLALLGHSFRGRGRGVAFAVWGTVAGVSSALGPVLGGVITTGWSWWGIFLVNVPIGVAAAAVRAWKTEESLDGTSPSLSVYTARATWFC